MRRGFGLNGVADVLATFVDVWNGLGLGVGSREDGQRDLRVGTHASRCKIGGGHDLTPLRSNSGVGGGDRGTPRHCAQTAD